ncbi:MAG TPA: hypothetical protein VFO27_08630 [Bryobacteraceae bacterium]|nr:hypothetical protein [Bryobacteraceae bacterium]
MPVLCLAALAAATLSHPFDHSAWDRVLKAHVNGAGDWAINDPGSRLRSANPLEREAAHP